MKNILIVLYILGAITTTLFVYHLDGDPPRFRGNYVAAGVVWPVIGTILLYKTVFPEKTVSNYVTFP